MAREADAFGDPCQLTHFAYPFQGHWSWSLLPTLLFSPSCIVEAEVKRLQAPRAHELSDVAVSVALPPLCRRGVFLDSRSPGWGFITTRMLGVIGWVLCGSCPIIYLGVCPVWIGQLLGSKTSEGTCWHGLIHGFAICSWPRPSLRSCLKQRTITIPLNEKPKRRYKKNLLRSCSTRPGAWRSSARWPTASASRSSAPRRCPGRGSLTIWLAARPKVGAQCTKIRKKKNPKNKKRSTCFCKPSLGKHCIYGCPTGEGRAASIGRLEVCPRRCALAGVRFSMRSLGWYSEFQHVFKCDEKAEHSETPGRIYDGTPTSAWFKGPANAKQTDSRGQERRLASLSMDHTKLLRQSCNLPRWFGLVFTSTQVQVRTSVSDLIQLRFVRSWPGAMTALPRARRRQGC